MVMYDVRGSQLRRNYPQKGSFNGSGKIGTLGNSLSDCAQQSSEPLKNN